MPSRRNTLSLLITVLIITAVATMAALRGQTQKNSHNKVEKADESHWPVADFEAPDEADPVKRAKRREKNKRYDNGDVGTLSPKAKEMYLNDYFPSPEKALPAADSDVVVIGEITDAQGQLSNDKTGVYSEFTVRVEEVLKNSCQETITPSNTLVAERAGGRVRYKSGLVQRYILSGQGMPRAGRRYVLFLKYVNPGFYINTGYELRGGSVFPIDGAVVQGSGWRFDKYTDVDETSFLNEVRSAIAQPQQEIQP